MAIWTFNFYLLPEEALIREHGEIPKSLDSYKVRLPDDSIVEPEEDSHHNYWEGLTPSKMVIEFILSKLPATGSWSTDAQMFGDDESHKIEIWHDDLECALDARDADEGWVLFFMQLARMLACKIACVETGKIIDAEESSFWVEYERSRAKWFVEDPKGAVLG